MTVTPAGWYPAPHANNELRYWNGREWLEPASAAAEPGAEQTALVAPPQSNGLGIAALVVGIIAFLTGLIPWLGLVLASAAIALGIFALLRSQRKGFAITGLVLGGVAFLTGLIVTIVFSLVASSPSSDSSADRAPVAVESSEPSPADDAEATASPTREESSAPEEPEEPATSADGSVEAPFPQPYIATGLLGGENYSLAARVVAADANAQVEEWNMFNDDAPAGFKYVVVELTMTGIDPDGVEPSIAEWDLYLATDEGNRYSSEYVIFGEGMPSMSDGPTLYPGNSFTGYTAYIVPEASRSFLLYDNGNYVSF